MIHYRLSKKVISQFIRTDCRRRLRLDSLAGSADRREEGAPEKDAQRPGLTLLADQGRAVERERFRELEDVFGDAVLRGDLLPFDKAQDRAFAATALADRIGKLKPHDLLLEAEYKPPASFEALHGIDALAPGLAARGAELALAMVRPDILWVVPPDGQPRREIIADGSIGAVQADDVRLGLKIIDIKSSGEASPGHFAELAYYGMILAAWLLEHRHADRFFVLAQAAIWPGKHEGSTIGRMESEDRRDRVVHPDLAKYRAGLLEDLETMPPEVVCSRVSRFLAVDLPAVLRPQSWSDLPLYIDSRCQGCDYLGFSWASVDGKDAKPIDPRYCWPTSEATGHLSRVKGLSEGASGKLAAGAIPDIKALSGIKPGHRVFETHQALRAARTVLRKRAEVLDSGSSTEIADRAGTSAVMPRFADIRVSISADYDIGSGLTFAFGYLIEWFVWETPQGGSPHWRRRAETRPMLVEANSISEEGLIFRTWLTYLVSDVRRAERELTDTRTRRAERRVEPSIQFYLWDELTFKHLCRVMSRHLLTLHDATGASTDVPLTSWLFPAETTLEDADYVGRDSPITVVSNAINVLLAAPIPHHYSLVGVANDYATARPDGKRWEYRVNKFYMDPLSDQIPPERGHEIWNKRSPFRNKALPEDKGDYQEHRETVRRVVREKLSAILSVTERLTKDLGQTLTSEAPLVRDVFAPRTRLPSVPSDGQIIYQHSRLLAAAQRMDIDLVMAMPPHEREARFRSLRVEATLTGAARGAALKGFGLERLDRDASVHVFQVRQASRDAKLKEGEYLLSLMPEDMQAHMPDWTVMKFKRAYPTIAARCPEEPRDYNTRLRDELRVEVVRFDRAALKLVVSTRESHLLTAAIDLGVFDVAFAPSGRFGVIDPVVIDFFTSPKLKPALQAIKTPQVALDRPLFADPSIAKVAPSRRPRTTESVVAQEFIWDADRTAAAPTGRDAGAISKALADRFPKLTPRQSDAIIRAGTKRLALWWGPPGTGKSETATSLIATLVALAKEEGRGVRICITGQTWVSIENVLAKLPQVFAHQHLEGVEIVRVSSRPPAPSEVDPRIADKVCVAGSAEFIGLGQSLLDPATVAVIGSTADQITKIAGAGLAPLFDVLLIDEASQMDVAHAIVAFTKLAPSASVVVVGDDRQMPPIHPIEPPEGCEHLLGSVYDFYASYGGPKRVETNVDPIMLDVSFRSNKEIVEFVREAGYGEYLTARFPDLRIGYDRAADPVRPAPWPKELAWFDYDRIIDASEPLVAVIHPDIHSSQRNQEEANVVVGVVLRMYDRGLLDIDLGNSGRYGPLKFFKKGVGIVTPHRAQQSAILDGLLRHIPPEVDRAGIVAAVDTVERFQGQEKAVMIASFGLGDRDQIGAEETFLYSLNRFNVIASRAKAKLIVFMSRRLVDHLPRDRKALEQSRLLKHFADGFLRKSTPLFLPGFDQACELRTR